MRILSLEIYGFQGAVGIFYVGSLSKILKDGEVIAICDKPNFIRLKEATGVFVTATAKDAQGVAVAGTPYNLYGHDEIKCQVITDEETGTMETVTAPEVLAVEIDGGEFVFRQDEKITEVDETAIAGLMATTDLYEQLLDKGVLD